MTPELLGPDRDLLRDTLQRFTEAVVDRGAGEQLLMVSRIQATCSGQRKVCYS